MVNKRFRASSNQVESPDRIKMLDFKVLEQLQPFIVNGWLLQTG
jgi:hypothetical protein